MGNNYYPFKRVRERIGKEQAEQMIINPGEKRDWTYTFATDDGDYLIVKVNCRHEITSVVFTPYYKGVGLSLKRAKRKGYKACWHIGHTPTSE